LCPERSIVFILHAFLAFRLVGGCSMRLLSRHLLSRRFLTVLPLIQTHRLRNCHDSRFLNTT
jgi:hypothetical protein